MEEDWERHQQNNSKAAHPQQDTFAPAVIPSDSRRVPPLIRLIIVANMTVFLVVMFINNCPHNTANNECFARFLGRFSFQPLSENPWLGPSAATFSVALVLVLRGVDGNKKC